MKHRSRVHWWVLGVLGLIAIPLEALDRSGGPGQERLESGFRVLREKMVERQLRARGIKSEPVLRAMGKVPRHRLVPDEYRKESYDDTPLPIGQGQTISQPYMVALMTELLELSPSDRVLEVGTGSGYQAAVLSRIVDKVYSVEIYRTLHDRARKDLEQLGYTNVTLRHADGSRGWPEHAPFDGIVVTCAASHIPPALVEQLGPGGKMVIPVGPPFGAQRLLVVRKSTEGRVSTQTIVGVRFVPFLTPEDVKKKGEAPAEPRPGNG